MGWTVNIIFEGENILTLIFHSIYTFYHLQTKKEREHPVTLIGLSANDNNVAVESNLKSITLQHNIEHGKVFIFYKFT